MHKIGKIRLATITTVFATLAIASPALTSTSTSPDKLRCTTSTARIVLEGNEFRELCSCTTVTRSLISYIRRHEHFDSVVEESLKYCPSLAAILIDIPTATIAEDTGDDSDGQPGADGVDDTGDGSDDTGDGSDDTSGGGSGNGNSTETNGNSGNSSGQGGSNQDGNQGNN